jgi:hypothetical protein
VQEIDPQTLTTHEVDKIGAKTVVTEEQVNAIEVGPLGGNREGEMSRVLETEVVCFV